MKAKRLKAAAFFLALIILVLVISYNNYSATLVAQPEKEKISEQGEQTKNFPQVNPGSAVIFVPAVDSAGNGLLGKFEVKAEPGNGKTLANIEHLLFFLDTQSSIQIAKSVATNLTGIDITKYNLIYNIDVGENVTGAVGGPSAGAALTIATVAALENKTLRPDVMITGTINPDGSIGPVGEVPQKAKAARTGGANIFLVPSGQGLKQIFTAEISCEQVGNLKVCKTEYKPKQTLSIDENGLLVREVANIQEALKYFLQQ